MKALRIIQVSFSVVLATLTFFERAHGACLETSQDPDLAQKLEIDWTRPARFGGAGAAGAGALTLVVLGGAAASASSAIPAAAGASAAGSVVSAYAFGCGAIIAGTAGVVLLARGGLVYLSARHFASQHMESVARLATGLFEVEEDRPLLPGEATHAFEIWANELAWKVFDSTDRGFFPHERDIAQALKELNRSEEICPSGQLVGLKALERAVISNLKRKLQKP